LQFHQGIFSLCCQFAPVEIRLDEISELHFGDPDPARLCTPAARDPAMIEWACWRSIRAQDSGELHF
jgi:hypothetical protein